MKDLFKHHPLPWRQSRVNDLVVIWDAQGKKVFGVKGASCQIHGLTDADFAEHIVKLIAATDKPAPESPPVLSAYQPVPPRMNPKDFARDFYQLPKSPLADLYLPPKDSDSLL